MSNEYDNNFDPAGQVPEEHQSAPQQPVNPYAQQSAGTYRMSGSEIPGENRTEPQQSAYTDPRRSAYTNPYQGSYTNPGPGYGYTARSTGGANYNNPMSGYNVKPVQPKKKSGSKRVVALALVCALIGGLGGGAAVGMALRGGASAEPAAVEDTVLPEDTDTKDAGSSAVTETEPAASAARENDNISSRVIEVTTNSETTEMTPQDVYEHYVNAVVAIANEGTTTNVFGQVSATASSGSGFIITEDGYIVTNNHVVSGAEKLTVTMTNGEEYEAEVIGADAENDVALIKIEATGLPTVAIGSSDTIEVGEQVCAIGNPLGELTNTLTVGYVSALDREINENGTPINMFQTDCAINAGNSGGPIFDMNGNVVGITTAKYSANSSYEASIEGIGFCVPINDAMDIVSDLLEYGYVKGRPSLGISCQAISSTVTQYYHLPTGVYVYAVQEGSAADNGGLQEGDIITGIDGEEVQSITEFKAKLKEYSAGDTAILSVYRSSEDGAETLELAVTFDEKQ